VALINAYCTLSDLKESLNIEDIQDDTALEAAIMASSRMIDDYTGRFFYKDGTVASPVTRYYTAQDWWTTNTDDFISISEIATDDNFDQLYTTVWASSDYMVEPINNPRRGWPYTRLLAIASKQYGDGPQFHTKFKWPANYRLRVCLFVASRHLVWLELQN